MLRGGYSPPGPPSLPFPKMTAKLLRSPTCIVVMYHDDNDNVGHVCEHLDARKKKMAGDKDKTRHDTAAACDPRLLAVAQTDLGGRPSKPKSAPAWLWALSNEARLALSYYCSLHYYYLPFRSPRWCVSLKGETVARIHGRDTLYTHLSSSRKTPCC